ncbi:MAG: glycosyltransferase [Lachnospiraceae bacterium]
MRILHYMLGIPPVRGGGLIRYATDLMQEQQRQGENVSLLIPGRIKKRTQKRIKIKKQQEYKNISTYCIENPLPISMGNGIKDLEWYTKPCDTSVYAEFLKKLSPDVIHLHSLMGLHKEFLEEAKKCNIPVIFSTHDYFGICPITTRLKGNCICTESDWSQCSSCCQNAYSEKKLKIEQSGIYRWYRGNERLVQLIHGKALNQTFQSARAPEIPREVSVCIDPEEKKKYLKLQQYYREMFALVTKFHFNSETTKQVYTSQLGEMCKGNVIPISHAGIGDHRKKRSYGNKLRIGYLGGWQEYKGFYDLLQVVQKLYEENKDVELHLYSETQTVEQPYVVNHKKYSQEQLGDVMDSFDLLVVPSKWQETFGFVVLEALFYAVPVLVSEYVGAKDLLKQKDGMGFIYDGTRKNLEISIEQIYQNRELLRKANEMILDWHGKLSFEAHVKNMICFYRNQNFRERSIG